MAIKITTEIFIEKAKKIHFDKYNYNNVQYRRYDFPVKILCKEHGIFEQKPTNHLLGNGCPKCSKNKEKNTLLDVIDRFKKAHKDKYDYSLVEYKNRNSKIDIICPEHGIFKKSPLDHWNGSGCPECLKIDQKKKLLFSKERVIKDFKKIHNDRYDYSLVEYNGSTSKIIIECSEHGIFKQTPMTHKTGAGCPKCAIEISRTPISELIQNFKKIHNDRYDYSLVNNFKNCFDNIDIICKIHGKFSQSISVHKARHGCPQCKSNSKEEFLTNLFKEYNINYIYNDRNLIKPLEIDILIPDFKFGIEHNGLLFHSYGISNWSATDNYDKLDKNKHLSKTKKMEKVNYQLFHIREDHLLCPLKKEIWKSILLNKCGISHKMHARKLNIIDLSNYQEFTKTFLEENHLQGSCPASIKLGLQDPKTGIVYSIMTFGKSRFNKNIKYELLRFCNLKYHNVRGAASKLLKAFERTHKPYSLVSYANRDWSMGNLYSKLGFEYSHTSEPNYIYTNERKEIFSRQQTQKHKLKNFLESRNQIFIENLSERDNMIGNGYRIYYDTGNLVYYKNYKRQFNDTNN